MTFAKTFGQRHVLRFLSSHIDLSGCRITAASPVGLRVTDGVHQLCLKSTDGCIQREDDPNSVAPEVIEVYGSTARRTAMTTLPTQETRISSFPGERQRKDVKQE